MSEDLGKKSVVNESDEHLAEISKMYDNITIRDRINILVTGLKAPRDSKEHKEAMIELQRLSAPAAAVLIPVVAVLLLIVLSTGTAVQERVIETKMVEAEQIEELEEIEPPEPPDEQMQDVDMDIPFDSPNIQVNTEVVNQPMSPQPQPIDAVLNVPSPVIIKNIFGASRNTGTRGVLLSRFHGDAMTEAAVLRALRWLKKNQRSDGSWGGCRTAMTGLAILCYLAHNEKPGESEEFGPTVQKALEFLMSNQRDDGRFRYMDGNQYAHPIATYALCEAYGMTINPNVKYAAEKALVPIIKGQHPTGGWTYKMFPGKEAGGAYRDDTSYMGWCAQALKAAKMAKLHVEGLTKACKLAIKGFKKNYGSGGFGYVNNYPTGLTSVGTLCMLLLGAGNDKAVRGGQDTIENWTPLFLSAKMSKAKRQQLINDLPKEAPKSYYNLSLQYYLYYATQCKFHQGGSHWVKWNKAMKGPYVKAQIVEKNAIKDPKGRDVDIGHWENTDQHSDRPVMDTCLAALQLMVYYRYLPTTSKAAIEVEEEIVATSTDKDDIQVDTGNL